MSSMHSKQQIRSAQLKAAATELTAKQKARMVMKSMRFKQTFGPFDSRSSDRQYTVQIDHTDKISCNCPAWVFNKARNIYRTCDHLQGVVRDHDLVIEGRMVGHDGYFYVVPA